MKKYYAVKTGRKKGIFRTWNQCKEQVDGYSGAEYKSFKNKEEALRFIGVDEEAETTNCESTNYIDEIIVDVDIPVRNRGKNLIAYVDGSNQLDKIYGFGVVIIDNEVDIHHFYGYGHHPDMCKMRNVSGEILGAMNAVDYALKHHYENLTIYYDYEGIEKWVTGQWRAKNKFTQMYKDYMTKSDITIKFVKVEAHTGVEYNEVADKLAKKAIDRD